MRSLVVALGLDMHFDVLRCFYTSSMDKAGAFLENPSTLRWCSRASEDAGNQHCGFFRDWQNIAEDGRNGITSHSFKVPKRSGNGKPLCCGAGCGHGRDLSKRGARFGTPALFLAGDLRN